MRGYLRLLSLSLAVGLVITGCSGTAGSQTQATALIPQPKPAPSPTVTPLFEPTGASPAYKVVTTTTIISTVVSEVGGELVQVTNLVPPLKDSLEYEITSDSLKPLRDANLFLLMGYEGVKFPEPLVKQAGSPNLKIVKVDVPGDWMIPSVQHEALDAITGILIQHDPKNTSVYKYRAADFKGRVTAMEERILTQITKIKAGLTAPELAQGNVIASEKVADFVRWAGLNVVVTFGTLDTTPREKMAEIIEKGRASQVTVVFESFQDWEGVGEEIAGELVVSMSFISRYPGGYTDTGTWEKAILRSIQGIVNGWC
jgi:zinc transport system substrate-binding protein